MAKKKRDIIKPRAKDVPPPPEPLTLNQRHLIKAICEKSMIVTTGPAGTGKTFLSSCYAGWFYKKGHVKKIILTRPNIGTGSSIGYFPGTLDEKMEPWVAPFISSLQDYLGKGDVENLIRQDRIEIVPFEVIRGRTFNDAFVILDEAQNTTVKEMKAFVSRHGENATAVINGDLSQSDLKTNENGLSYIKDILSKDKGLQEEVSIVNFTSDDIVRSDLCKLWIQAFEKNY